LYEFAVSEMSVFAQKGDNSAQNQLAWMYENGLGVRKNMEHAQVWYLRAASSGYAESQFNLARLLSNGDGVSENKAQAIYWLEQAAKQGFTKARVLLTKLQPQNEVALN